MSNTLETVPNSPPSGISAESFQDLKRKSVRSGVITFASQGASVAIQLTSTVVLSRFLSPNDYGVIAMILAVTGIAGMFRDLGLSLATVQRRNLTQAQSSTLFWINVGAGFLLTLIVASASPLLAWFYGRPELMPVTIALSANFLIGSIGSQHNAHLTRAMQFGKMALASISSALAGLTVSIIMAASGFNYWALVGGSITGAAVGSTLAFLLSGFRPGMPVRGSGVREMLKFGVNVTAFDFVNYFHRNLDNILIGKFWGAGPLGLYSRAYSLLMFPITNIRVPINSVAFPAMSKLKDNPNQFRAYFCRVCRILAFASMPLTAFLFISARLIIEILLGNEWLGIAPIFSVLALVGFIQPVLSLFGLATLSAGMDKRYLRIGIFNSVCCGLGFLAGCPFGPVGVAIGYAIATYLTAYPLLTMAFHGTSIRVSDFIKAIIRPIIASLSAGVFTYYLSKIPVIPIPIAHVIFLFVAFIFFYVLCYFVLPHGRSELREVFSLRKAFRVT